MSDFDISVAWLPQDGKTEAEATFCSLLMEVADRNVTEFIDDRDAVSAQLEIPAYYLAEWIAENWWALLWEPRKNEDESEVADKKDGAPFLSRHSTLSAQHGFALPRIMFVPQGKSIQISAARRTVPTAKVRFRQSASIAVSRDYLGSVLKAFIGKAIAQLEQANIRGTYLQDAWLDVTQTTEDEVQFCRLVGALGLSPYDIEDPIAELIERMQPILGERLLLDLCLASTPQTFPIAAGNAEEAIVLTRNARTSTLSPIETVALPNDNLAVAAYRRGVTGATFVRKRLGIKDNDPSGATKVFEALEVDTSVRGEARKNDEEKSITGAVLREESKMKVALLQETEGKRRFAAARAIFAAWSSENPNEGRLLTSAVTRDQQANRAFAAELTAPRELLRSKAKGGFLSRTSVYELADMLRIGADVVAKHAANNHLRVANL
jgi:hypothetical protein